MRPLFTRNKMKYKICKKKFSQKKSKFCGCPGTPVSDIDNINQILRVDKLRLSKGQGSWKVMPKDSCEVYKERRKRQLERNRQSYETENNSQTPNKTDRNRNRKRGRKAKYKYRSGRRRRYRKLYSPCSCCSIQTLCTCSEQES